MKNRIATDGRFSARALEAFARAQLPQTLSICAAANGEPTEILLYDAIGWGGITAKDFVLALAQAGDGAITLRINSPGGDVFDGMAIYNSLLARSAPVNVFVDGIAASAASFIAMAGSKISMAEASMLMVHNAFGFVIGNRHDMLDTAMVLEKIDGQLAQIYATKCGKSVAETAAMMDAETWFTSTDAKAAKLCDAITAPPPSPLSARAVLRIRAAAPRAMDPVYPACDPDNPDPDNPNCDEMMDAQARRHARAELPAYDPDGDGDNDAEEAMGHLNSAMTLLDTAMGCLTGSPKSEDDGGEGDAGAQEGMPIVPGASAEAEHLALQVQVRLRRHRLPEAEAA